MLGRLDEAYAATAKALAVRPNPGLAVTRWVDARLAGDARATEFEAAARKLATSNQLVSADADLAVWDGRLAEFRRLAAEARAENQAAKNASIVAEIDLQAAVTLAALQRGQYLEDLRRYLEPSQPVPIVAATARTFALAGDVKTVRGVLPRLEQALDDKAPADQNTREATTVARAYVKAADGHGKDAIADLDALIHEFPRSQDINYSIGHIRETMGDLDEAAAAYRRVIDAHVMLGTHMTVPATRLALGQLLAKRGDAAGAKEQFDILRAQWKSADADFMMLQALKSVNGQ
jgi:tetratricopeptide (TPR) repeat protein